MKKTRINARKLAACIMAAALLVGLIPMSALAMTSEEASFEESSFEESSSEESSFEESSSEESSSEKDLNEESLQEDSQSLQENSEEAASNEAEESSQTSKTPEDAEPAEGDEVSQAPMLADLPEAAAEFDGKIYLGGTGDDANDGLTPATAVKTFAKAKELLEANNGNTISVVSTVRVEDSQDWDLGEGKTIIRDPSFTGKYMISMAENITLKISNIILDGGYQEEDPSAADGSVIFIEEKKTGDANQRTQLYLNGGCVIQNAYSSDQGGAVQAQTGSKIVINGGVIQNCSTARFGGGIFSSGIVVLGNGSIKNCYAGANGGGIFNSIGYVDIYYGKIENCSAGINGGGVYLVNEGYLYMNSDEGAITGCTAQYCGGGVYMNGIPGQCDLFFDGGTISGNSCGVEGGGIFCSKGLLLMTNGTISDNTAKLGGGLCLTDGSIASIRGELFQLNQKEGTVYITGNTATGSPQTGEDGSMFLSSGGIYVDGRTDAGNNQVYPVSKLYLCNTLIKDNYAAFEGGGLALCPTGSDEKHINDGSAIYGNSVGSGSGSDDVMVIRHGTTTADGTTWTINEQGSTSYIPAAMLGGGAYHWKGADGNEIPLNELHSVRELRAHTDVNEGSSEAQAAEALATVFITGNSAPNGHAGGIGNNGKLYIGQTSEPLIDFVITKTWDDAGNEQERPEAIRVEICRDDVCYGFVDITPDENGNWSKTITGVPKEDHEGNIIDYIVKEVDVVTGNGRYIPTYASLEVAEGYEITNTFSSNQPVVISKTDITGTNEIKDASLVVTDEEGNEVASWISVEGESHTVYLQPGTYTLTETKAPENYVKAESITFTVDENGVVSVGEEEVDRVVMKDDYTEHLLKIVKENENDQPLSGAAFVVSTDKNGNSPVASWTSSNEAYSLNLKPGTYYITEKTAPEGYQALHGTVTFVVAIDGTVTVQCDKEDQKLVSVKENEVTLVLKNEKTPEKPESSVPTESSTPTTPSNSPKTGENWPIAVWSVLLTVSAVLIGGLWVSRKKCL